MSSEAGPRTGSPSGPLNICWHCGYVSPLDAEFCRNCAYPLSDTAVPQPEPVTRAPAVSAVSAVSDAPARVAVPAASADRSGRAPRGARAIALGLLSGVVLVLGVVIAVSLTSGGGRPAGHRFVRRAKATAAVPLAALSTRSAARRVGGGPLATVSSYWDRIDAHNFAAAYRDVAPRSLPLSPVQFISYERGVGVQRASFQGSLASRAGGLATVAVGSLVTQDLRFGCQTWSGTYKLIVRQGHWLIGRADIRSTAC